ncbi:AraC family transcriptional regulator [Amycolatopsis pithecellobii]|uniref:Helix-turn-helix domain-containing protein n=1 Tax=Amycolatopsis pithecellobii TaxID=664692 RepID=A0A6N7ZAI6_9PSEU|nr:AraC family transcriptional regulator [Amycolatopsis pithecellobii]MTD58743.1 helix-turn-helix domain-containing protein [Amycolatopsis pithecellobii]
MALPLHGHELFRSTDLDDVRTRVSQVLCPHQLGIRERGGVLDAQMNSLALGDVTLNYVHYRTAMWVDPGCTKDFIALQLPVRGRARVRCGVEEIDTTPGLMLVSRADEPMRMELSADAQVMLTKMSWPFLLDTLNALIGAEVIRPLRFDLGMNIQLEPQKLWFQLLALCYRRASRPDWIPRRRLSGPHLLELLAIGLLRSQPNTYSEIFDAAPEPAPQRTVRQAMTVLDETPDRPHTDCSLARALGVSALALGAAFQTYCGTTVHGYLFHVRMRRAHADLCTGEADVTVEQVARRWGFTLAGFQGCYQREFGEAPNETLLRH